MTFISYLYYRNISFGWSDFNYLHPILGGEVTKPGRYPFTVALGQLSYLSKGGEEHSGLFDTLQTKQKIMTEITTNVKCKSCLCNQ